MSIILAIETSSDVASVALLRRDAIITREAAGVVTHSQTVLPMVQALLADAGLALKDCDAVAFGSGPGSFTGVRTACGIAQGLAYGAGIPLLPIVTLLALAQSCREQTGAADVLAMLDARMGEVYWAQYRFDEEWQLVVSPTLSAPAGVIPLGEVIACGNGLKAYAADFQSSGVARNGVPDLMPRAAHIATLGAISFTQGKGVAASAAEPLYLRNKVAYTMAERAEKTARGGA